MSPKADSSATHKAAQAGLTAAFPVTKVVTSKWGIIVVAGVVGVGGYLLWKSGALSSIWDSLKSSTAAVTGFAGAVNDQVNQALGDVSTILPYLDPIEDIEKLIAWSNQPIGIEQAMKTQISLATYPLKEVSATKAEYDMSSIWPGTVVVTLPGGASEDWRLINGPNSAGNYTPSYQTPSNPAALPQKLWLGTAELALPIGNAAIIQTYMYALGWQGWNDALHQLAEIPFLNAISPQMEEKLPCKGALTASWLNNAPPLNWNFRASLGWTGGGPNSPTQAQVNAIPQAYFCGVGGFFAGDYIVQPGNAIAFGGNLLSDLVYKATGWSKLPSPVGCWQWPDGRYGVVYSMSSDGKGLASNVPNSMAAAAPDPSQIADLKKKGLIAIDIGAWYPVGQRPVSPYI